MWRTAITQLLLQSFARRLPVIIIYDTACRQYYWELRLHKMYNILPDVLKVAHIFARYHNDMMRSLTRGFLRIFYGCDLQNNNMYMSCYYYYVAIKSTFVSPQTKTRAYLNAFNWVVANWMWLVLYGQRGYDSKF